MADNYYITINGEKICVSEEVYDVCRQMRRQERTLAEKDSRNFVLKYEDFADSEITGEEQIYDFLQPSVTSSTALAASSIAESLRVGAFFSFAFIPYATAVTTTASAAGTKKHAIVFPPIFRLFSKAFLVYKYRITDVARQAPTGDKNGNFLEFRHV